MPLPSAVANALDDAGIVWDADAPLARLAFWRAGGPADALVVVHDRPVLQTVQRLCTEHGCPIFVLGNGSNVLISDQGVRGVVLRLAGDLADCRASEDDPPILEVGAGFRLIKLLALAKKNGWTGIEAFTGIPGTVGGAVFMNAGASLGETRDCLIDATLVLADGTVQTLDRDALAMRYRHCTLPEGAIIASARFQTTGGDPEASRAAIRHHLERRRATQPLQLPSCGSTFRNPPGDHAGRLIEAAGLKGYQVGNAQVSEMHANFIVNLGGATASDIRSVIEHVRDTVEAHSGIRMVQEVKLAGDWSNYTS